MWKSANEECSQLHVAVDSLSWFATKKMLICLLSVQGAATLTLD